MANHPNRSVQGPPINQDWIKKYVETLLKFAEKAGPSSAMGASAMVRAEHAMDLVKAWREHLAEVKGLAQ